MYMYVLNEENMWRHIINKANNLTFNIFVCLSVIYHVTFEINA